MPWLQCFNTTSDDADDGATSRTVAEVGGIAFGVSVPTHPRALLLFCWFAYAGRGEPNMQLGGPALAILGLASPVSPVSTL